MIDDDVKEYIVNVMMTILPELSQEQVLPVLAETRMVYDRNKSRKCVGSEVMVFDVVLDVHDFIDRESVIRAFSRRQTEIGGKMVEVKMTGSIPQDFTTATGHKNITFNIEFTHDIYF